jgi:hypothetical protein
MKEEKLLQLLLDIQESVKALGSSIDKQCKLNTHTLKAFRSRLQAAPVDSSELLNLISACEQFSEKLSLEGAAVAGMSVALRSTLEKKFGTEKTSRSKTSDSPIPHQNLQVSLGTKNLLGVIDWRIESLQAFASRPLEERKKFLESNLVQFLDQQCQEVPLANGLELLPII